MIVGSTDRTSTREAPAFALIDTSGIAIPVSKETETLKGRIFFWVNTLPLLEERQFLPAVRAEGERYLRGPRNAIPHSSYPLFGLPPTGSRATVATPANAAIAADCRANFGRDRLRF